MKSAHTRKRNGQSLFSYHEYGYKEGYGWGGSNKAIVNSKKQRKPWNCSSTGLCVLSVYMYQASLAAKSVNVERRRAKGERKE